MHSEKGSWMSLKRNELQRNRSWICTRINQIVSFKVVLLSNKAQVCEYSAIDGIGRIRHIIGVSAIFSHLWGEYRIFPGAVEKKKEKCFQRRWRPEEA